MDHYFCPRCQGNLIRIDLVRKHYREPRPPIQQARKCYCSSCSELQAYRIVDRLTSKRHRRRDIKAGVSVNIPPDNDSDDLFNDDHTIATSINNSEEESLSNLKDLQTANYPTSQDNLIRSL